MTKNGGRISVGFASDFCQTLVWLFYLFIGLGGTAVSAASADRSLYFEAVETCLSVLLDQDADRSDFEVDTYSSNAQAVYAVKRMPSANGFDAVTLQRVSVEAFGHWTCGLTGAGGRPSTGAFLAAYRPDLETLMTDTGLRLFDDKIHNVGSFIGCQMTPPLLFRFQTEPGHIVTFLGARSKTFERQCAQLDAEETGSSRLFEQPRGTQNG
ncbi:MAG: hypothetical protein AAGP08_14450 [Pseudomonadota bacterium]